MNGRRLTVGLAIVLTAGGYGSVSSWAQPGAKPAAELSVGIPVPAREVSFGTVELEAAGAGSPATPGFRLLVPRVRGADPRDLCVVTVPIGLGFGEGSESCDVRARGQVAVSVQERGVPDRLGVSPTVVAGIAPPDVTRVELDGPGGRHVLPLSGDRAFLALYAHNARGPARLIATTATGRKSFWRFSLPLPRRPSLALTHRHRRPGVVFNDEVGENIVSLTEPQLRQRFGSPAAVRSMRGVRCDFYTVVGQGDRGWRFCFAADGHMLGAHGNLPVPPRSR